MLFDRVYLGTDDVHRIAGLDGTGRQLALLAAGPAAALGGGGGGGGGRRRRRRRLQQRQTPADLVDAGRLTARRDAPVRHDVGQEALTVEVAQVVHDVVAAPVPAPGTTTVSISVGNLHRFIRERESPLVPGCLSASITFAQTGSS